MTIVFAQLRTGLALCFALALALRVVAMPWAMAAPEPGLIAICAGGKITYISIDGTPIPEEDRQSEDCPLHGVAAVILPGVAEEPLKLAVSAPLSILRSDLTETSRNSYARPPARAPPLFV